MKLLHFVRHIPVQFFYAVMQQFQHCIRKISLHSRYRIKIDVIKVKPIVDFNIRPAIKLCLL